MIIELTFLIGLTTGLIAALILFLIVFRKKDDDFEKRQERYKKMI